MTERQPKIVPISDVAIVVNPGDNVAVVKGETLAGMVMTGCWASAEAEKASSAITAVAQMAHSLSLLRSLPAIATIKFRERKENSRRSQKATARRHYK